MTPPRIARITAKYAAKPCLGNTQQQPAAHQGADDNTARGDGHPWPQPGRTSHFAEGGKQQRQAEYQRSTNPREKPLTNTIQVIY